MLLAAVALATALGLAASSRNVGKRPGSVAVAPVLVLDPNTAPPQALAALPHVGPALASRLVEARAERPFTSLDDLRGRVRGVGPVTLARIAPHLVIDRELLQPAQIRPSPGAGSPGLKRNVARRKRTRSPNPPTPSPEPGLVAQADVRAVAPEPPISPHR
jgi:hypothetical protein